MDKTKIDKMSGMLISDISIHTTHAWLTFKKDQQIGQLYELMQAIRKQDQEDEAEEAKNKPENDKWITHGLFDAFCRTASTPTRQLLVWRESSLNFNV